MPHHNKFQFILISISNCRQWCRRGYGNFKNQDFDVSKQPSWSSFKNPYCHPSFWNCQGNCNTQCHLVHTNGIQYGKKADCMAVQNCEFSFFGSFLFWACGLDTCSCCVISSNFILSYDCVTFLMTSTSGSWQHYPEYSTIWLQWTTNQ